MKTLEKFISITCKTLALVLPSVLVFVALNHPTIRAKRARPIFQIVDNNPVHEVIPDTSWSHMRPCGEMFDEQKEFGRSLQCVNSNVFPDSPVVGVLLPRCFIVSSSSPDVVRHQEAAFNAILLVDLFDINLIVGFYEPETETVFVVENEDAAATYRHELQHHFLHLKVGGGNASHSHEIWQKCESPHYVPSVKNKLIQAVKDLG